MVSLHRGQYVLWTLILCSTNLLGSCTEGKRKFAGKSNFGLRSQDIRASSEKTIETLKKQNIWIVSRNVKQKEWTNIQAENGSSVIKLGDVSGLQPGMDILGDGLTENCDDAASTVSECRSLRRILSVDTANATVTIQSKLRYYDKTSANKVNNITNVNTINAFRFITIPITDQGKVSVGMLIGGPGLDTGCDDPATTAVEGCPGRGMVISMVNDATKSITTLELDKNLQHGGLKINEEKKGLEYFVYNNKFTGNFRATTGVAYWLQVEGDKLLQQKQWTGINPMNGDNGARTYVTEGGFLVARFPFVYFIDPENTPEGPLPAANIKNFDPQNKFRLDTRMCLASYIKNDKRYMIAAFGPGNYYEIPMGDASPHKPLWDDLDKIPLRQIDNARGDEQWAKSNNLAGIGWGYSCAINQKRKIFYSQWAATGPKTYSIPGDTSSSYGGAIDLNSYATIDLDKQTPNAKFVSNHPVLKSFALGVSSAKGSYAVAGDPDGNIYNADRDAILPPIMGRTTQENNATYTMAYEKASDTVWVSRWGYPFGIIKRKCLTTEPNCADKDFWFGTVSPVVDTARGIKEPYVALGPLSALKDGRMVAVSRVYDQSVVRIFTLKDPSNLAAGVDVLPIASVKGDPYMYVDFTGATLYTREAEQTFKINDVPSFAVRTKNDKRPDKVLEAYFEWKNIADTPVEWKNMKLEARCYDDAANKGNYQEIPQVANAGEKTLLELPTCKGRFLDAIDIKITQIKGETLGDNASVKIHIKQ